jgi:dsRNA-specific ribonuclease
MWILKWFPNWFFYSILIAGFVGIFISKYIPAYYRSATLAASIAAFVFGVFMAGGIHDNEAWLERVREMEAKVAKAEEESKDANDKISESLQANKQKLVEKKVIVKEFIDREIVKYNETCTIPHELIEVINKSATK